MLVDHMTRERFHVIYRDRGRVVHDEILCESCYEQLLRMGAFRKALNRRGRQTEVLTYHGDRVCDCEAQS